MPARGNRKAEGTRTENSEIQALTLRLPVDVYEAMKTYSFATQTSLNEVALRAIRDFLANDGHREEVSAFLDKARDQYRVALDKLADL